MVDYSSPIYRAELMMTGRIFAQSAELYADIVFANEERRELLSISLNTTKNWLNWYKQTIEKKFIREFEGNRFLGDCYSSA